MATPSSEFIAEMNYGEGPFPSRDWRDFDPPFPRAVVAAFERRGWVETRGVGRSAEHRWTVLGQAEQVANQLRGLGYRVARPHGLVDKLRAEATPPQSPTLSGQATDPEAREETP